MDGHDLSAMHDAILRAKSITGVPSAIVLHTVKGQGCTFALRSWCHHMAVSKEDMEEALRALNA